MTGRRRRGGLVLGLAAGAAALGWAGFHAIPQRVARQKNPVARRPPYEISEQARDLHRRIPVVDLHADSLLWGRDLLARADHGHLDLPRMVEGGIALEGLAVCTKVPHGANLERNDDRSDDVTLLALAQRWPPATWRSLPARARYHALRARAMADRSDGRLTLIATQDDLARYLARRRIEPGIGAAFLAIEGAHALDGDPANLDPLVELGYRMVSPTHFFDNAFGGSAHGVAKGGLTAAGRELIARMEARSVIADVAHASSRTIDDVLALASRPVIASHTGVRACFDSVRNLSDEHVRGIAATGGLVGIGFWPTATGGDDVGAIVRSITAVVRLAGVGAVGLGSDFDGAVPVPFDASGIALVTDGLLGEGFSDDDIAAILGGNALRVLGAGLPAG